MAQWVKNLLLKPDCLSAQFQGPQGKRSSFHSSPLTSACVPGYT